MFKLSTKSSYGLRAVFDLARHQNRKSLVTLSEISNRQKIPKAYLEQILSKLRRADVIQTIRGPHGGFRLGRTPDKISVGDIVRAVEGDEMPPVLCSMPEHFGPDCHEVERCLSRLFCQRLDGQLQQILESTSVADLCGEAVKLENKKQIEFPITIPDQIK